MAKRFDDIAVNDQLELKASRTYLFVNNDEGRDPSRVVRVAIVTDIWFDPVDDKKYVGLAYLKRDGSHGKPTEKRTITGLARAGWERAGQDWLAYLAQINDRDTNVISISDQRVS